MGKKLIIIRHFEFIKTFGQVINYCYFFLNILLLFILFLFFLTTYTLYSVKGKIYICYKLKRLFGNIKVSDYLNKGHLVK